MKDKIRHSEQQRKCSSAGLQKCKKGNGQKLKHHVLLECTSRTGCLALTALPQASLQLRLDYLLWVCLAANAYYRPDSAAPSYEEQRQHSKGQGSTSHADAMYESE